MILMELSHVKIKKMYHYDYIRSSLIYHFLLTKKYHYYFDKQFVIKKGKVIEKICNKHKFRVQNNRYLYMELQYILKQYILKQSNRESCKSVKLYQSLSETLFVLNVFSVH